MAFYLCVSMEVKLNVPCTLLLADLILSFSSHEVSQLVCGCYSKNVNGLTE